MTNRPSIGRRAAFAAGALAILALVAYLLWWRGNASAPRPRIEIHKAAREVIFVDAAGKTRTYRAALGSNPLGAKQVEGDGMTPEGVYFVCVKNPRSQFHLSLGIDYPASHDAERGRAAGLISPAEHEAIVQAGQTGVTPPWKTALGGEIFIHGGGSASDWTQGCIALDNADMDELFAAVDVGIPVIIRP